MIFHKDHITNLKNNGIESSLFKSNTSLFSFFNNQLTLGQGDYNGPGIVADVSLGLSPRLDVRVGVDFSQSSARSNYRDFTDANGFEIEQRTTLQQVDLTGSVEFALTSLEQAEPRLIIGRHQQDSQPIVTFSDASLEKDVATVAGIAFVPDARAIRRVNDNKAGLIGWRGDITDILCAMKFELLLCTQNLLSLQPARVPFLLSF